MKIDIITLFPDMFIGPFGLSIINRAREEKFVDIGLHDLRKWAIDVRGTVDDRPYGGGVGMILRIEPIFQALQKIKSQNSKIKSPIQNSKVKTILMDARGEKFTQAKAREYSKLDQLVIVCGHYEGVDERVKEYLVDESISIGDYVLTGGEIPAMVITDAITRLLPGVLEAEATKIESFSTQLHETTSREGKKYTEYSQYTRPEEFHGWKVPKVLLSGNHEEIRKWRKIDLLRGR